MFRFVKTIKRRLVYILDAMIFAVLIVFIYSSFNRVSEQKKTVGETTQPQATSQDNSSNDLKGIDVSHYQGTVDWEQVSDTYHFAFIKATESSYYLDPAFIKNIESVNRTNMAVGAYHFFSPEKDAVDQARHFLDTTLGYEFSLPPVLDVEVAPNGDTESFQNAIEEWINLVKESTGCTPILYSNKNFWSQYLQDRFAEYPIWISDYTRDDNRVTTIPWSFWQFTDSGNVEGVSGPVDESRYRGNETTLKKLGSCEA